MNSLKTTALLVPLVAAALTGCGKKPAPETPSPPSAPSAPAAPAGDRDKLQGMWAIEALDDGERVREKGREDWKDARLKFEGDKFTIIDEGETIKYTFTLDETQNPKVLLLTELLDAGQKPRRGVTSAMAKKGTGPAPARGPEPAAEPAKEAWIYKFDGDTLTLAACIKDGGSEKPTEFKARPSKFESGKPHVPGVTVITLKKTDVPAPPAPPNRFVTSRMSTYPATRK